ncbi:MAG TPA: helicase [Bacteroidales bacterium]|nr:helicase [Bacteroidales bacterium]
MAEIILTQHQQKALRQLLKFVESNDKVFILKGYAGTGKTTLVRKFIEELSHQEINYRLLASTGRAAKVLSNIAKNTACTVHSQIYKFKDFNQDLDELAKQEAATGMDSTGQLYLTFELNTISSLMSTGKTIYIIDEASMVADALELNITQAFFGSGRLLTDLLDYDPNGQYVFVGDHCQLPPVVRTKGQSLSPALSVEYFKNTFGIKAQEVVLENIMRQKNDNDIIIASKKVRNLYYNVPNEKWGKLPMLGYRNIKVYNDSVSMLNNYIKLIKEYGYNHSTLICYYNRRTSELTSLVRPALGRNALLESGDLLLVTQNNIPSGLMNGDMVVVTQVSPTVVKRANLTFRNVEVYELFTRKTYSRLLIEELIYNNEVNLDAEQQKILFKDFYQRMKKKGIAQKSMEFNSLMMSDPYLNALRCVYGYAITCHKAQGGEWEHVFLDIPRNLTLNPTQSTYQWIYTAMTRARVQLHIVNDFYLT